MELEFSTDDVKALKLVTPNQWYRLRIISYEKGLSKEKDSTNYKFLFRGLSGDAEDVPFRVTFNEKFFATLVQFIEHVTGEKKEAGFKFDIDALLDKEVDAFVIRGSYNNKERNEITRWRNVNVAA